MLVCSKILGCRTAERNWKQYKGGKTGQRARAGNTKIKKQVLIYSRYQQMKAQARQLQLSSAGKMWDDDNFMYCKMDAYCHDIVSSLQNDVIVEMGGRLRIFRAWTETWEKKKVGPQGDPELEARLVKKYGGLKWLDIDNEYSRRTVHPEMMYFEKKRGNNRYHIFALKDGFDMKLAPDKQKDLWDVWELENGNDFYEEVCKFYSDDRNVKCYGELDDCDSESENMV